MLPVRTAAGPGRPARFESVGRSAIRHPVLVALVAIFALFAGTAVGYFHHVTYQADAELSVGDSYSTAEASSQGLADSLIGLATDYAQLVTSGAVTAATEKILHTTSLPGTLSATADQDSALVDIEAQAPTEPGSVVLADAGVDALVQVVDKVTEATQAQLSALMANYQRDEQKATQDTARANLLQGQLDQLVDSGAQTAARAAEEHSLTVEIAGLQTAANVAQLQAQTYSSQYSSSVPPLQGQDAILQQVGPAYYSGSDHRTFTEAAGLLGLVGGLVIGLGAACWLDDMRSRRAHLA